MAEHVLCAQCEQEGQTTLAQEVDHIVPFKGKDDPLRLDPKNLQSLCSYHHHQKHQGFR
jgi:5-methylcytosine-specific restriction protein A